MKIRNILLLPTVLLLTLSGLTSCGEDRWPEYAHMTEVDQWITSVMREHYLWYKDIPADEELNLFIAPDAFLKSITSQEDNGQSHIDTIQKEPTPSYGFDYALYPVIDNDTAYHALITYTLPHSPASTALLKRGEWIMKINDEVITRKNEKKLFEQGDALTLLLGNYTTQIDPETETEIGVIVESRTAHMEAKQLVEESPVHYHQVITTSNGIKIGYLVYSHFEAGTPTEPQRYNDQLRTISREFADAGITHFILDLRYNKGGSLDCAQLLSALVAPSNALGQPLGSLQYSDKQAAKNSSFSFDSKLIETGANLNITQGFILSTNTTSGTSGTLLNLLSPLQRWGLVGSSVTNRGVTTERFNYPNNVWALYPVVCEVLNAKEEIGLGTFTPNKSVNETSDLSKFLPFGDVNEALLSTTIGLIDGSLTSNAATFVSTFPID